MRYSHVKPLGMDLPSPNTTNDPSQSLEHIIASVLKPFSIRKSITHTHFIGSVSRAIAPNDDACRDANFVDASRLDKTSAEDIAKHFRELIAPAGYGRLASMWEEDTQLDLEGLAGSIVAINQTAPEIADCLVELRLSNAYRLLHNLSAQGHTIGEREYDAEAVGELKEELDQCYPGVLGVALLWHLRKFAEQCATQIHRPMGWDALDDLDKQRSGSTLTVGTLCDRMTDEIALTTSVLEAHAPFAPANANGTCRSNVLSFCSKKLAKSLRTLWLEDCARKLEGPLRRMYGRDLERHLGACVIELKPEVERLRCGVRSFERSHHRNRVYGNIDRTAPAVLLYISLEQVYSWLAEPRQGTPSVTERARQYSEGTRRGTASLVKPRIQDGKAAIDNIFALYRIIFLKDNEALPKDLRRVTDKSGNKRRIRSISQSERETGVPLKYESIFKHFEDRISEGKCIDLAAKREANRIKRKKGTMRADVKMASKFAETAALRHI